MPGPRAGIGARGHQPPGLGQGITRGFGIGQAIFVNTASIAVIPLGGYPGLEPGGGARRQGIERVAHGFADALEPIEHVNGGQDVGGISSLAAFGLDQSLRFEQQEHLFKDTLFGTSSKQAGAKVAEHGGIKAGVSQFEGQGILPVNARTHRVGGLAVGQVLGKLHYGDERELGRSLGGSAVFGEEVGKVRIGVDRAKGVTHMHIGVTLGESGTCDPRGLIRNKVEQGAFSDISDLPIHA